MGHEVSHAILQHGNERMSQGLVQQLGVLALQVAVANKPAETQNLFMTAYGVGATGRSITCLFHENMSWKQIDMGLIWTAMAGYNPRGSNSRFGKEWKKQVMDKNLLNFLSTHPSEGRRIEQLEKYMPEALEIL